MPVGDEWSEHEGAMVGHWPSPKAADDAVYAALTSLGHAVREQHERGLEIVRLYELAGTTWIAAATEVVVALAVQRSGVRILGVEVEYGDSGNSVESVFPVELGAVNGHLEVTRELGEFPAAGDAHEAALEWCIRMAARTLGLDVAEAPTRRVFYAK